jgi:hypothetical protein
MINDNNRVPELQLVIEDLPAGFDALRADAFAEGYRFVERLVADWMSRAIRFDREGEALLAAHVNGVLAGIGGLTIEPLYRARYACGGSTSGQHSVGVVSASGWLRHCLRG